MDKDKDTVYVIMSWGIVTGITVFYGAYIGDYIPYKNKWVWYVENQASSSAFLGTVLTILASIYAIALPLTVNTIHNSIAPYGPKKVAEIFRSQWEVYYQSVYLPLLMGYIVLLLFFDVKNGFNFIVVCFFTLYTIYNTYKYYKIILNVSVNPRQLIIKWSSEIGHSKLK